MRLKSTLFLFFLLTLIPFAAQAKDKPFSVGVVDMNRAINFSTEGQRSKKFLEAQFTQTQKYLKQKEQELIAKEQELGNMIMISPDKKKEKENEIITLRNQLREELAKAQQDFRTDEARHTEKIFKALLEIVKDVSKKKEFDLVLEARMAQTILYSKFEAIDITDEVIQQYNQKNKAK